MMKKNIVALAILAASSINAQAQSVDITVTGTLLPSSCTPTLSNGGVMDWATIQAGDLKYSEYTYLNAKTITLSVACDAPTAVAIEATSLRPGSVAGAVAESAGGIGYLQGGWYSQKAGLGLAGTDKIGGYALGINTLKENGTPLDAAFRDNQTGAWQNVASGTSMWNSGSGNPRQITPVAAGSIVPQAIENLTMNVTAQPYINKASELDLSSEITLDGLANFELIYL
ncbi:DUF1120 domain-containing protein [Type-E symbiont of Plautia stali]|uniref:DUF1120 domain-containing protein n=1 Tax=Type-E symbiont of Plautia stali TaxID=1560357 RepID=UPI00073F3034|nr:DUF1120 domain-containing protein [Type-E symbiont of Plautia stali]